MKLKYTILTPSKLLVKYNNKELIITGEVTVTPIFYADIKSIKKWETPFENEIISETEKQEIIRLITEESSKTKIPIIFD